ASGRRIGRVLLDEDDRSAGLYLGLSGLCVASLMGALAYFTPPLGLTEESLSRERLYTIQQYLSASAERNRALSENRSQPSSGLTAGHQGATQAAKGAEGKFG